MVRFVLQADRAGVSRREIAAIAGRVFHFPGLTISQVDDIVTDREISDIAARRSEGSRKAAATRARDRGMEWTPERVAELTKLWNSGHTAAQIAKTMGVASRSTILGKVWRMGLTRVKRPTRALERASDTWETANG